MWCGTNEWSSRLSNRDCFQSFVGNFVICVNITQLASNCALKVFKSTKILGNMTCFQHVVTFYQLHWIKFIFVSCVRVASFTKETREIVGLVHVPQRFLILPHRYFGVRSRQLARAFLTWFTRGTEKQHADSKSACSNCPESVVRLLVTKNAVRTVF